MRSALCFSKYLAKSRSSRVFRARRASFEKDQSSNPAARDVLHHGLCVGVIDDALPRNSREIVHAYDLPAFRFGVHLGAHTMMVRTLALRLVFGRNANPNTDDFLFACLGRADLRIIASPAFSAMPRQGFRERRDFRATSRSSIAALGPDNLPARRLMRHHFSAQLATESHGDLRIHTGTPMRHGFPV